MLTISSIETAYGHLCESPRPRCISPCSNSVFIFRLSMFFTFSTSAPPPGLTNGLQSLSPGLVQLPLGLVLQPSHLERNLCRHRQGLTLHLFHSLVVTCVLVHTISWSFGAAVPARAEYVSFCGISRDWCVEMCRTGILLEENNIYV